MKDVDNSDGRTAALKIAHGLMWFFIWLGFGGCCYLADRGKDHEPLIVIKTD